MTAKEFLSQAWRIDMRINSKLEQVQSLRCLAEKATSTISDMPRPATRNIHRMEDVIVKIMDLESDINADIEKLVDIKRQISEALSHLTPTEYRTLLELRYICCKTWEEIAAEMYYSLRHTHRVHGEALQDFTPIMQRYLNES
jgi:DNA-directed RNA polymerase specialized sigma24 family protein